MVIQYVESIGYLDSSMSVNLYLFLNSICCLTNTNSYSYWSLRSRSRVEDTEHQTHHPSTLLLDRIVSSAARPSEKAHYWAFLRPSSVEMISNTTQPPKGAKKGLRLRNRGIFSFPFQRASNSRSPKTKKQPNPPNLSLG